MSDVECQPHYQKVYDSVYHPRSHIALTRNQQGWLFQAYESLQKDETLQASLAIWLVFWIDWAVTQGQFHHWNPLR